VQRGHIPGTMVAYGYHARSARRSPGQPAARLSPLRWVRCPVYRGDRTRRRWPLPRRQRAIVNGWEATGFFPFVW